MSEDPSRLTGATDPGDPAAYPATPGEFAARWNEQTEERRAAWLAELIELAAAADRLARTPALEWRPGRWWTVVDKDGVVWCETSDEDEARRSMTNPERAPYSLHRQWVTVQRMEVRLVTEGVGEARSPERAPVLGNPDGRGSIEWWEHVAAWEDYAKRYGRAQSAERIAERGGFSRGELARHLGHAPTTFVPGGDRRG